MAPAAAAAAAAAAVGVLVVTSPARSHPSTELIWATLRSLARFDGLDAVPLTVVCDGYRAPAGLDVAHAERLASRLAADPCRFSKRGIVSNELAEAYERFKDVFAEEALTQTERSSFSIIQLDTHHGFALAVREGLHAFQKAGLAYALIVQHDRGFIRRVSAHTLNAILSHFKSSSCRYIGFPSGTSKRLASRMAEEYQLHQLLAERSYDLVPDGVRLRPCVFWYDSNHLVDVDRALQIFEPYNTASDALRRSVSGTGLNRFRLRRGDFIEERFGVEQRNLLVSLRNQPDELLKCFDWFGCYMLEETMPAALVGEALVDKDEGHSFLSRMASAPLLLDKQRRVTYVAHLDARSALPPSRRSGGQKHRVL